MNTHFKVQALKEEAATPDVLLSNALEYVQKNGVHGVAIVMGCKAEDGGIYPVNLFSCMPFSTLLMLKESLNAELTKRFLIHLDELGQ